MNHCYYCGACGSETEVHLSSYCSAMHRDGTWDEERPFVCLECEDVLYSLYITCMRILASRPPGARQRPA